VNVGDEVTIGELSRKVDALTDKIDGLVADLGAMQLENAKMSGRVNGGLGVLIFLGTVAGAFVTWLHTHWG